MSLRYNVSTLLREPVGSTREYEVDGEALIDDEGGYRHVVGRTTFLRTKDGVLVTARLQGAQHEPCSRCLQEVDVPLAIAFEDEFIATVDADTGVALAAPDDPEAFRIDANHTLDLTEPVRQGWTAALPMQPLCRPDCRGICPRCGQDSNRSDCSCSPEEDQRWNALRQLAHEVEGT